MLPASVGPWWIRTTRRRTPYDGVAGRKCPRVRIPGAVADVVASVAAGRVPGRWSVGSTGTITLAGETGGEASASNMLKVCARIYTAHRCSAREEPTLVRAWVKDAVRAVPGATRGETWAEALRQAREVGRWGGVEPANLYAGLRPGSIDGSAFLNRANRLIGIASTPRLEAPDRRLRPGGGSPFRPLGPGVSPMKKEVADRRAAARLARRAELRGPIRAALLAAIAAGRVPSIPELSRRVPGVGLGLLASIRDELYEAGEVPGWDQGKRNATPRSWHGLHRRDAAEVEARTAEVRAEKVRALESGASAFNEGDRQRLPRVCRYHGLRYPRRG
jgi:hypothetical protein